MITFKYDELKGEALILLWVGVSKTSFWVLISGKVFFFFKKKRKEKLLGRKNSNKSWCAIRWWCQRRRTRLAAESVNRTASVGDSSLKIDAQFESVELWSVKATNYINVYIWNKHSNISGLILHHNEHLNPPQGETTHTTNFFSALIGENRHVAFRRRHM